MSDGFIVVCALRNIINTQTKPTDNFVDLFLDA